MENRTTARATNIALIAALTLFTAGCELIGDIFQAGFVVGIIIVILIVAVIGWFMSRFRGRPRG